MTPVELSSTVLHAVRRAVDEGELSVTVPERAVVTVPGPGGCGDYATNIALQLARPAGQPPLRVAELLRPYLTRAEGVTGVEITGPGFLNISLDSGAATSGLVRRILRDGLRYGHSDALAGQLVQLHVPYEVRAEVLADTLARVIGSQGGRVEIDHREPVNLRPVPAPEDPAPLGPDAARWALLHPAPHDRPRISAEHLVQREGNPLFRVRYAHARTRALGRNAADLGFASEPGPITPESGPSASESGITPDLGPITRESGPSIDRGFAPESGITPDPGPITPEPGPSIDLGFAPEPGPITPDLGPITPEPGPSIDRGFAPASESLLAALADHPRILTATATARTPDRLARHLVTVADAALVFLPTVLPQGAEKPSAAHRARLALAEAAGTVLAGGLSLLGIDAPDHL